MNTEELNNYLSKGHGHRGAGYLRFILMFVVCIWNYGFPESTGYVSAICGFAAPAFFILSGYFILSDNREVRLEKVKRKMKRTLGLFLFVFVMYFLMNVVICLLGNIAVRISLRTVFDFLVLNLWFLPAGSVIWFIQALLYAYIVIYIADKIGLLKFYKVIMFLTFLIMIFTGEFAGLIHFNVRGYTYIPGNWLTRALPYILLGMFMREKNAFFTKISTFKYLIMFMLGAELALGELYMLSNMGALIYMGHMIGYGVMALAVCGFALSKPEGNKSFITVYDTALSGLTFIFMEPMYYLLAYVIGMVSVSAFYYVGGLLALFLSIGIAFLLKNSLGAKWFFTRRHLGTVKK